MRTFIYPLSDLSDFTAAAVNHWTISIDSENPNYDKFVAMMNEARRDKVVNYVGGILHRKNGRLLKIFYPED